MIEWIPVIKDAYKHRDVAFTTWDKVITQIFGPESRISFVGHGGVGKTVLLDYVTGKAFDRDYKVPPRSTTAEKGTAKAEGFRIAITVAPGQGGPMVDSFEKVFDPKKGSNGIVFVASNGFNTLRDERAVQASIDKGFPTIADWRNESRKTELAYLNDVLVRVRDAKRLGGGPDWMLVAVTKVDLYFDELEEAKSYYSPYSKSKFASCIGELQQQVGSDNFEWDAAPVCAHFENFIWGNEIAVSTADNKFRNFLLDQFVQRLGEFSR